MGIYDVVKDAASIAQKADNIELYKTLLDVQQMALDMQEELTRLRDEIKILKDNSEIANKIIRYHSTYITLCDDENKTIYCSRCWDKDKNLVQVYIDQKGNFQCPECNNKGLFSKEIRDEYNRKQSEAIAAINRNSSKSYWD